jgi:hypothetical protein
MKAETTTLTVTTSDGEIVSYSRPIASATLPYPLTAHTATN